MAEADRKATELVKEALIDFDSSVQKSTLRFIPAEVFRLGIHSD